MSIKRNLALLRIVAMMLLCSLALTGCMGTEGSLLAPSEVTGDYLTPEVSTENTEPEITTTVHEHTFGDATCTLAKTCSVCGAVEGEPLGHTWSKATCSTAATCKYCGQTTGTTIDHSWKEATCTAAATCIVCGKTKGSAAEHKWKSATCTTPKTCTLCGKTKGSAAAHKYSKGTCTTCGKEDPAYGESSSSMVWIPTRGGKKYHSHSGCSNMKNPEKVSLSRAKKLGFTACKKCYG